MLLLAADSGFGGISTSQLALLFGGGVLIYTIMRWRKMTVAKRNAPPETTSYANPLSVREVAAEVQALLADLEETSRRLTAQLDNRYTRLEQLLAEADEKIRQLEALTNGTGATQQSAEIETIKPAISDAQRTLSRLRQERGAPPAAQDPAYEPIYSLADRGKNSREIAQELGRQPGEIELILALRQRAG